MKEVFRICALFISLSLSSAFGAWNASKFCTIRVADGHYLTAVGGGGKTTNVLHTDATRARTWERFRLIDTGMGNSIFAIQTYTGHYLSAQGGGGRHMDAIHSNRTRLLNWEIFKLIPLADGWYGIQTYSGHYLVAIGGGGRITDPVISTDGRFIGPYMRFKFSCRPALDSLEI